MSGLSENYVPEITVRELKQLLDENKRPFILDVREESEYAIANLGGYLIPLGELVDHVEELKKHCDDELIVVHCRSGGRSAQAVRFLHAAGLLNAKNLRGGTLAWSKEIDPSLPTY
ncbi:MAG: rhodanese-like domain-containing protein [Bacteroidetes bacterium]|nr:rhodanese-like domain-containing protein [Bacteroidota bacterium]